MSEFKFACPVCRQHITADSGNSGTQIECPTCFQKIVVPQAPASDSKLILSAAQAGKPRPGFSGSTPELMPDRPRRAIPLTAFFLVVFGVVGAALVIFRDSLFVSQRGSAPVNTNALATLPPTKVYPVPTNSAWSTNLARAIIPNEPAAGRLNGRGFRTERSTIQGGNLTLRQGKSWPPDLGFSVQLHAKLAENLGGKTIQVGPSRPGPVPRITLRYKENGQATNRVFTSGYTLKIVFGQPAKGRMPGEIYLALPDEQKSFVAGLFDAEIRQPTPPKQKTPKTGS